MREIRGGKVRLREEMRGHVDNWKKSHLSKAEYARRQGLTTHKFDYWIRQFNDSKEDGTNGKFVSLNQGENSLEITLSNKVVIRIPVNISEEQLKNVLKAVSEC